MEKFKLIQLLNKVELAVGETVMSEKVKENINGLILDVKNEAINFIPCCAELKTVKQGENLILDNKFDVQVVIPESSVLIKHKEKDRLIWIDKQRLKRN